MNLLSWKKFLSLPEVAVNQSRGKALGDGGLRFNMSKSILSEAMLNKVTVRNLIRSAGIALSYWSPRIYDHVNWWKTSCVQGVFQESTNTALHKEDFRAQGPKFNWLKNRNNLRTTGFNLLKGERSVHSTLRIRKGIQANILFVCFCRSFSHKILSVDLNERVTITEIKQQIDKCKNKDGRYGNLIQIISSPSVLNLAYLTVKSNSEFYSKEINKKIQDSVSWETIVKISKDVLSGQFKISLIPKSKKNEFYSLVITNLREKIVQKAIEIVLTIIYEDVFLDSNHGFRPGRSSHTTLKYLQLNSGNPSIYSWVIKGKIKGYFDKIPHRIIMKKLKKRIDCPSTLFLIKNQLNVNYLFDSEYKQLNTKVKIERTIFQDSQLYLLLCNIVFHELDFFVEENLKMKCNKSKKQRFNLEDQSLIAKTKDETSLKKHIKPDSECLEFPPKIDNDKSFKKLFYVRHADNWIVLLAGSYQDAKFVFNEVSKKLQKLSQTLSMEQTNIISLKKGKCRFIGVDFSIRKTTREYCKPMILLKKKKQ